tara:strand:- start:261 stop:476 length:216 start_codon:yes stop_codon:yes gene_type:complete
MGIKDALLKTAKKKLTKFLQQVELQEGEDLPAIVMTTIDNETYLKIVSLKAQDGKLVIIREIDGVSLGDIL